MANYTDRTVYAPDGTQVHPTVKDTNGNYFDSQDTLGRTPITVVTNCDGNPNKTCYDIVNSQGNPSRVTVTTTSINVSTNFGQAGVTEYSGAITVIQSIALPDGTSYTFDYDSGTAPGNFGLLKTMTLPTGGQVAYTYATFQDSYGNRNRWVNTRASGGGTWTYTRQVVTTCTPGTTGCKQKVTIAKPSGDNVVYTFTHNNGAWPTTIETYSGPVSPSNLLQTVNTDWDFTVSCPQTGCTGSAFIRVLKTTRTLPVPAGAFITNKVEFGYDNPQNGNRTILKEWKFYAGSSPTFPTNPDRRTDTTYLSTPAYTNKNIISLPVSVAIRNESAALVAQTNITYDSGSLTSVTGVTHHDDANFGTGYTTRGNATQIQRCVVVAPSCSSSLTTTLIYDTTGQLLSIQDPKGNTTSLSYADNFYRDSSPPQNPPQAFSAPAPTNAYLTSVTLPLIGAASLGYYFHTGKRASSTDQNGADSYTHFLDNLDRLTHSYGPTVSGSRPWSLIVYPPNSQTQVDTYLGIGDTSPSTGCASCRHDQVILDNLGRVITQKLVNDPEGATSVTTTYDSSGRPQNVSNPFRTTGDPTYGIETPSYDGINRVTQVQHADNNTVGTYYGAAVTAAVGGITSQLCPTNFGFPLGYPTLVVDEAGKKRQTWADGFGTFSKWTSRTPAGT